MKIGIYLLLIVHLAKCNNPESKPLSNNSDSTKTESDFPLNDQAAYRNINFGISKDEYKKQNIILLAGNKFEFIGNYAFSLEPEFTEENQLYYLGLFLVSKDKLSKEQFTGDKLKEIWYEQYEWSCYDYLKELLFRKYSTYFAATNEKGTYQIFLTQLEKEFYNQELLTVARRLKLMFPFLRKECIQF